MPIYLTILFFISSTGLFGQTIDSLGLDNNPRLTKDEAKILNDEFGELRGNFDFTGKKAAFITGPGASIHETKIDYFKELKLSHHEVVQFAVFLTPKEKIKSGGYDVLVLVWVKVLTNHRRRKIVDELKRSAISK